MCININIENDVVKLGFEKNEPTNTISDALQLYTCLLLNYGDYTKLVKAYWPVITVSLFYYLHIYS